MGKVRRKKFWLIVIFVVFVLLAAGVVIYWLVPESPQGELRQAREALNAAQKEEAEIYAPSLYKEAQQLYDSAMVAWAVQNDRFFLNRDYEKVSRFSEEVIVKAREATVKSEQLVKNTNTLVKKGIADLEQKVRFYDRVYKQMPLPTSVINAHNKGQMKLSEAKIAFENNRFNEAKKHYQKAAELVNSSNEKAGKILNGWFAHYPQWKKHGDEAIRLSKSGQKVILIDKYAHKCMVYQSGKKIKQFDAELGMNWMGDKRHKGDKATPEGIYRITQKKERASTKFHRALLINYPNEEDKKRFAAEKKNGTLSSKTNIGNLIEIHGLGGKGVDWTDGCVALRNEDMDALYRLVGQGTQVIIVGSLKPLSEINGKN